MSNSKRVSPELPQEIVELCLAPLPLLPRFSICARVCKMWYRAAYNCTRSVTVGYEGNPTLHLSLPVRKLSAIDFLHRLPNLEDLNVLSFYSQTPEILNAFWNLVDQRKDRLRSLSLPSHTSATLQPERFVDPRPLTKLEFKFFGGSSGRSHAIGKLLTCCAKTLSELTLRFIYCKDEAKPFAAEIAGMKTLRRLEVFLTLRLYRHSDINFRSMLPPNVIETLEELSLYCYRPRVEEVDLFSSLHKESIRFPLLKSLEVHYYHFAGMNGFHDHKGLSDFIQSHFSQMKTISLHGLLDSTPETALTFLETFSPKLIRFDLPDVLNQATMETPNLSISLEKLRNVYAAAPLLTHSGFDSRFRTAYWRGYDKGEFFLKENWIKVVSAMASRLRVIHVDDAALGHITSSIWNQLTNLEEIHMVYMKEVKSFAQLLPNPKELKVLELYVQSSKHQKTPQVLELVNSFLDKCPNLTTVMVSGNRSAHVDEGTKAIMAGHLDRFLERNRRHHSFTTFNSQLLLTYGGEDIRKILAPKGFDWFELGHSWSNYEQ